MSGARGQYACTIGERPCIRNCGRMRAPGRSLCTNCATADRKARKSKVRSSVLDNDVVHVDDTDGDTTSDVDVCERCGVSRGEHFAQGHKFVESE
jgi:hypothetical protein